MTFKSWMGTCLMLFSLAGVCRAHDVWLVTKVDRLELLYGHETPEVYNPVKVTDYKGYDVDGKLLMLKTVPMPEAFGLAVDPRVAMITVVFDNGYWVAGSSAEWKNVSLETARTFPAFHHPVKLHKSLYAWSNRFSEPVGLALEIVPLRDPFKAKGVLPVRILFDGKPLPNAKVEFGIHGDKAPSLQADAQGEASVPVTSSGEQFIAVDFAPPTPAGADPVSYATSLRYELKGK
jgi:nickel transport protein